MLNDLCDRYSQDFMSIINFDQKFDSLQYLRSSKLKEALDKKFRAFNFKVDFSKYPKYNIGRKTGKDIEIKKPKKTAKDFLNE